MSAPQGNVSVKPASLESRADDGRDVIGMLDGITKRMVEDVIEALAIMGLDANVLPESSHVTSFGEWRDTLPMCCAVASCQIAGQKSQTLLSVPPGIISRLTDLFFGGDGEVLNSAPGMTLTEERIFRRLAVQLAAAHARALRSSEDADVGALETARNNMRQAREGDALVIQTLAITRGKTSLGKIEIAHLAARMRGGLAEKHEPPVNEMTGDVWRTSLAAAMRTVHVPVRSVIARPEISLERLIALVPGDIIPIIITDHIPVIVSGTVFALGSLGEANGHTAIRIEQIERRNR